MQHKGSKTSPYPQSKVQQKEEIEGEVHLQCDISKEILASLNFTEIKIEMR